MVDKIVKKLNFSLIIFLIIMMPTCFFLTNYLNVNLYFYMILHLIIPLELLIYIYNIINKNIRINKYDVLVYILSVLGIIVTIVAVDPQTSFWGAYLRNEGLLAIVTYYLLFLNVKSFNKEEIINVLDSLFIMGTVQFVYCILQVFVRGKYIIGFKAGLSYMASGFIGNPNMLGSFCVVVLLLSLSMHFIFNQKRYLIFSLVFYINLILAQSTGPFFAFVISFFVMMFVLVRKKFTNWKKFFLMILVFVLSFIMVSFTVERYCTNVFKDKIQPGSMIKDDIISTFSLLSLEDSDENKGGLNNIITTEDVFSYYGSGRLDIWRNSIKIIPKYWLFGAGIDNFGYVYPTHLYGGYVDKAHNEYLQILITEGIFALFTYLILLFNLFVDGIKSKDPLAWALLLGVIGYALQAFMNISVTTVAPFYFIVCGLLVSMVQSKKV